MENTKDKIIKNQILSQQLNTNTQNNEQYEEQCADEDESIFNEKRIIVYLIILTIVLLFISLFFIYDIVDRGKLNVSQSAPITYPEGGEGEIDPNNGFNGNVVVDGTAIWRIKEGTKEWSELRELDVFNREHLHVAETKIAPGVEDYYQYTVECAGDYNMKYNLEFSDENIYKINMVYKLKLNGKYVAGDEDTWVKIEDLSQSNLVIKPGTADVFDLEWRWEDADNDTEIGETEGAKYKINVKAHAEAIVN